MHIKEIWDSFSSRISEIEMLQRSAKESAKNELKELNEQYFLAKQRPELKNIPSSRHNMSFRSPFTGDLVFYDFKERTIEERANDVFFRRNKQYQWLLAEAYEEFEDFLEHAYAYYGKKESNFWPLSDYGNIHLNEIKEKDFKWYLERASKKSQQNILKVFRGNFEILSDIEKNNKLETDLRMSITLIEKLRHIIVHNGGKTKSQDEVIIKIMKESGLYQNGKIDEDNFNFINSFFGEGDYKGLVVLLEIQVRDDIPLDITYDIFMELIRYILSYAFVIYTLLDPSVKNKSNLKN